MPDPEIVTKYNEEGELVTYLPAQAIIGALEIEESDEQADTEGQ